MSSRRKHTSPKNGGEGPGGTRPQAHTWVRQIVACDNIVLDRQIVAWAVARGRRAQGHRLKQKKAQVRHIADLILNLKMRDSNYVNLTNGGKNGITIRLHSLGHKRMDRGAARLSCKLLLDHDVFRHQGYYSKECGRNYFPDRVSSRTWNGTLGYKNSSFRGEGKSSKLDWLQNQHQGGTTVQVYPKMGKGCGTTIGGQRWTIGPLPLTKLFWVSKSSPRKNLSQDGNHQLLAFGHCSWTTEQRQKSGILVNLSLIELKLKPGNYSKNFTKKNRINSFPPDPGREIAWGFFVTIIINNRIRPQAHN
jgi:hypothetical protein